MSGILVSSDEERRINDILDRGINEIQKNSSNTILKCSIGHNNSKDLNFNYEDSQTGRSNISNTISNSLSNNYNNKTNFFADKNPKSSALKQLLDEMKMSNKFLSSSEDEMANLKFNSNKNILISKENIFKSNFEDEPNLKSPQNINVKAITHNKLTNSNLNKNLNSNRFASSSKNKNKSDELKKDTNSENEMSFHDMKYDMKYLQDKINGLERKLYDGYNSSNIMTATKNHIGTESDNSINFNQNKNSNTINLNQIKSRKNRFTNCVLTSSKKNNYLNSHQTSKTDQSEDENNLNYIKSSNKRSKNTQSNILSITRNILNKSSNRSSLCHSKNNLTQENKFKEKYEKLINKNSELKKNLLQERKKVSELTKKNKKMERKEENYDKLNESNLKLNEKLSDVLNHLDESEMIRKEQAKLIKSLQREIDILRGDYHNQFDEELNKVGKLSEEYKELRKEFNNESEFIKMGKKMIVKKKKNRSKSIKKNILSNIKSKN